jgi:hypothetical protein
MMSQRRCFGAQVLGCCAFLEIRRVRQRRGALPAQMPEQALLRDGLGHSTEEAPFDPLIKAGRLSRRRRARMTLAFGLGNRFAEPMNQVAKKRLLRRGGMRGGVVVGHLAIELVPVGPDRNQEDVHARSYDSTASGSQLGAGYNPRVTRVGTTLTLVTIACTATAAATSVRSHAGARSTVASGLAERPVPAAFRVFDGISEVSAEIRLRVRKSGTTDEESGTVLNGPWLKAELEPGIYDAQAIHHRSGRVVNVRWAERLVVVRYPDEGEEHLEVINFVPNYGALQIRLPAGTRADPAIVSVRPAGGVDPARIKAHAGNDYLLVVAPAGTYTFTVTLPAGTTTLSGIEVPGDRTRLRVIDTDRQ